MSYDIQVWSTNEPVLEEALSSDRGWQSHAETRSLERKTWQIVCDSSSRILPEDIPEQVANCLPGISFLTEIILEPISAPESARKEALRTASRIAKLSHGIVLDRQKDELTTPRGVKRYIVEPRPERFGVLKLGWWFLDDVMMSKEGVAGFFDVLSTHMPEALPRRYGLYEPPKHLLEEEGLDHLATFLAENIGNAPVLYPHRPFVGLSVACTSERQHPRLGFRCNRISIDCEASVVTQPGWQEGLRRFWLAVCEYLRPFYSETRTLDGFIRMGATYGSDMQTDIHPIRSWFWRGIPRELGHATAISAPYIELWPRAAADGRRAGDIVILDAGLWTDGNNLDVETPDSIRQAWTPTYTNDRGGRSVNWVTEYPQEWPFNEPAD